MRFPFRRVLEDLRGRSVHRFVDLLEEQLDATAAAAQLVVRAASGEVSWATAREEMRTIEHLGDERRALLMTELSLSLTTPIDREDLTRVSRSIDDVLDTLRDFVRLADLVGLADSSRIVPVALAIAVAIAALRVAVRTPLDAPRHVGREASRAGKAAGRVRRAYDYAMAELFAGELVMDVLKEREALRRLDIVGLRLGEAADALSDAAVKRGGG